MNNYTKRIQERSTLHYYLGLFIRFKQYIKYYIAVKIARNNGAVVGDGVIMPIKLAKKLNSNVTIGNHVSIASCEFSSFKRKITIEDNVIIGDGVKFVMGTHNIDSTEWENVMKKNSFTIKEYSWLCPDSVILPSVSVIGRGSVIGANAVVSSNVEDLSVMSGNPAQHIRYRKCVHSDLVVESLLGGDLFRYISARHNKC